MSDITLNSLCVKLKYQFRNIVLLHEALTHNFEETKENNYFSPFPGVLYKQKRNGRLHTLGARVFEHLCVQQAVYKFTNQELTTVTVPQDKSKATKDLCSLKTEFQIPQYFEIVAKKLSLDQYIKTSAEFQGKIESLYESVIKAIFGAIFIDSGGCHGRLGSETNPIMETRNVFLHLWGIPKFHENDNRQLSEEAVGSPLSPEEPKSQSSLKRMSISDLYTLLTFDSKLNYKFHTKWVLRQALTTDLENEHFLEIFKALGESCWKLVICEYLYWFYVNDDNQTHFNEEIISLYCKNQFQDAIANALDLKNALMPKKAKEKLEIHNFLKSLIGGIYLDSGCSLDSVKKSIVHLCEKYRHQIAKTMQRPLPHSTKTYRGTYYHTMVKYSCIVDHGPPKRQEAFKITNASEFLKVIDFCEYEVKANHVDQMAVARKEEELDFKRVFTCSEDRCNQMEYERLSLYHTLERMRSDYICPNGDIVKTYHTYGKCLCKSDMLTADCSEVPEVTRPLRLTAEYGRVSKAEISVALEIVYVWMLMWYAVIYENVIWALGIAWRITNDVIYGGGFLMLFYMLLKKMYEGATWAVTWITNDHQITFQNLSDGVEMKSIYHSK